MSEGGGGVFGEWGLGLVGGGRDGVGKGDLGHLIALLGLKLYIRVDHLWIRSSMRFISKD